MEPDLHAAERAFRENFEEHGEVGASFSVWIAGREQCSAAAGYRDRQLTLPWSSDTPVLVWSATKGPASACVLHALQEHSIPLHDPVLSVWPEFAQAGKNDVTFAHVLSHQAGLSALDESIDVFDYDGVIRALERQAPQWPLGTGHGYHPRTFGYLLDEILRRVTGGTTLGAYWREALADPLELEFWIGVPAEVLPRVAPVFAPKVGGEPAEREFYAAFANPKSLTARAFGSPRGLPSVASMNTDAARIACLPAFGGIGTASALAQFYAMLAGGGTWGDRRFFTAETIAQMVNPLVSGHDKVFLIPTAFSAGFMKIGGADKSIFGHPGAGGCVAFADPENKLGFAYVMNQMGTGVLPNARATRIIDALYGRS